MFHYSGGFGQYAQVGRADVNLVPLPEEISFEAAASLGCRFMTGANVIALSRGDKKLALAKELGAVHTVKAGDGAAEKIGELTGGGAHVSADALGIEATTLPAIAALRTRGRHVRIGMSGKEEKGQIVLESMSDFGTTGVAVINKVCRSPPADETARLRSKRNST